MVGHNNDKSDQEPFYHPPIGHLLNRGGSLFKRKIQNAIKGHDLPVPAYGLLRRLDHAQSGTQLSNALEAGMDASTFGRLVDRMVDQGLIERHHSKQDRRANALSITQKGRALLHEVRIPAEHAEAEALSPLTAMEQNQLRTLLEKLLDGHDR